MEVIATPIEGLFEIQLVAREDARGYFMRCYDEEIFQTYGLNTNWVQENQSLSKQRGTVRGLHFQRPPHAETKLVRALSGSLLDVAVDLRQGSATYGRHHTVLLTSENRKSLYIPKGFAHGFCTVTDDAILAYKVDSPYSPQAEGGLRWNDSELGIAWPLVGEPSLISEKDRMWPGLQDLHALDLDALAGAIS